MAKNDRLYILTERHAWKPRICIICGTEIQVGEPVFSKARAQGAKIYCGRCAENVGLIDQADLIQLEVKQ